MFRLGSVSCGDPYSQSTSSQSINGVTTKMTLLEFPISGERGSGVAQVEAREQSNGKKDMQILVSPIYSFLSEEWLTAVWNEGSAGNWSHNSSGRRRE